MDRFAHYGWPFFEERHRKLAAEAESWARRRGAATLPVRGMPRSRGRQKLIRKA